MKYTVADGTMDSDDDISIHDVDPKGSRDPKTTSGEDDDSDVCSESSSETKIRPVTSRKSCLPTGCCYDDRMKLHVNADFSAESHHPEDPRRIAAIFQHFRDAGLVFTGPDEELQKALKTSPTSFMYRIAARKATRAEICLVHTSAHYEWVQSINEMTSAQLRELSASFDAGRKSLYVGNLTAEAALISAGAAIETCKSVVLGKVKNAFAVIRPPGHHAESNESMGFCIFNNVPMAASVCLKDYPELCRKVFILDWDVHHGNGIQNMFYEDPNVLYISIHVYQNGLFYPGQPEDDTLPDGNIDKCGSGAGLGKNINIGWADQGVGDGEYMAAFQRIVMPIAQEFNPDLVIVSAGFDAAAGDELGGCFVTPACYSHMTHMLMSLANGRLAVCLEGGYNLSAISRSALAVAKTLMGEPPERITIPPLNKDAAYTLHNVRQIQAAHWDCMRPGVIPFPDFKESSLQRVSEVARMAEKNILAEKFGMIPLYIQRTVSNKIFKNMVLASPELYKARKILVIVHDPSPELVAQPDPHTNITYAHNSYLSNSLLPYLTWATSQNIAIISVILPQHVPSSATDLTNPHSSFFSETDLSNLAREVLCYIYDNYIEPHSLGTNTSPPTSLTIFGIGHAYLGIKQLLISRNCRHMVTSVLCFASGNLKPVKSEIDDGLAAWYRNNSRIYVSETHPIWNQDDSIRMIHKMRFGNVLRAKGCTTISSMLGLYLKEATEFVAYKIAVWEDLAIPSLSDPDETEDDEMNETSTY
ncbi:Histone deacetylase clr3 [Golovinomyces cichoracearum]|uniref:Histone deacetylase n=1 Tax=Golovinomyces cichoracearum TaxID=62708 RepID=A0A420ISV5_9PEZI|nr:Histone deacetylase clr3 [Golovinomyces cichoracearum]